MGFEEAIETGNCSSNRRQMNDFSDKSVIDTNVPIVANLATSYDENDDIPWGCIKACLEVIDDTGEIVGEYSRQLSLKRVPGQGNKFIKWVHNFQWDPDKVTRISIHRLKSTYKEFPEHGDLENFDTDDRKFVAVANAHPDTHKPPIFQATDSKWWGWKDALSAVGIHVHFLCPDYVKEKYANKINR